MYGDAQRFGLRQQLGTHHTFYAAAAQIRGDQHAVTHQEQVAEHTLNYAPGLIEHQAFGMLGVLPFGTGEDLLKTIEVLEASQ
ncbi:hypothetical protein D9M69_697210 [compost metagenome]